MIFKITLLSSLIISIAAFGSMEEKDFPKKYKISLNDGCDKKKYNKSSETDLYEYFNTMNKLCPDLCLKLKQKLDNINKNYVYDNGSNENTTTNVDGINKKYFTSNETFENTSIAQITLKQIYFQSTPSLDNIDEQLSTEDNDYREYDKVQENSSKHYNDCGEDEDYIAITSEETNYSLNEISTVKSYYSLTKNKQLNKPTYKSSKNIHQKERAFSNSKKVKETKKHLIKTKKKRKHLYKKQLDKLNYKKKYLKRKEEFNLIHGNKTNRKNNALNLHNRKIKINQRYKQRQFQTKSPLKKNIKDRYSNHRKHCNDKSNNYIMID